MEEILEIRSSFFANDIKINEIYQYMFHSFGMQLDTDNVSHVIKG